MGRIVYAGPVERVDPVEPEPHARALAHDHPLGLGAATIVLAERAMGRNDRNACLVGIGATLRPRASVRHSAHERMGAPGRGSQAGAKIYPIDLLRPHGRAHVPRGRRSPHTDRAFVVIAARLGGTPERVTFSGVELYWHFVDIMWLMVASKRLPRGRSPVTCGR